MTCRSEYFTLLLLLVTSCGREAQRSVDLVALSTDSAGIRLITLSHGPEQWPPRVVLRADTPSVMRSWEFGAAMDVAPMSDGAVAVLDALAKHIVIFDSANGASTISRAGAGPGELQMTMAMEAAGSQLLVWQLPRQGNTVLAVLHRSGRVVATAASPVEGDWSRPLLRAPRLDVDGFQRGPEDVTRRIAAIGDSAFMVMIQDNEASNSREPGVPEESRPRTHVLLLDTSLTVVDTIAVLAGPVTRPQNTTDRFPIYEQPLFSGRPLIAAGDGWFAIAHGDSSWIDVRDSSRQRVARVSWPAATTPVDDRDRTLAAEWIIALQLLNSTESAEMYVAATRRERRAAVAGTANVLTPFSETRPSVTGMLGAGNCLFVSGFDPVDHPEGTSRTLLGINVHTGALHGPFRLEWPEPGGLLNRPIISVRAITSDAIYAIMRDGYGESSINRYRLPSDLCGRARD